MYYPIVLKIGRKPVLVVGGGEVAEAKVNALLDAGARVTVVSPQATAQLRTLAQAGAILWHPRRYQASDVEGAFLVISATNDQGIQEAVWQDAQRRSVLVNTVDQSDRCDFILPSVIREQDVLVTVSTSGKRSNA